MNVADGSAYLSTATAPTGSVPSAGLGSVAPVAGGTAPADAGLLAIGLSDPAANGVRVLSASVTDAGGGTLGTAHVTLPGGGW